MKINIHINMKPIHSYQLCRWHRLRATIYTNCTSVTIGLCGAEMLWNKFLISRISAFRFQPTYIDWTTKLFFNTLKKKHSLKGALMMMREFSFSFLFNIGHSRTIDAFIKNNWFSIRSFNRRTIKSFNCFVLADHIIEETCSTIFFIHPSIHPNHPSLPLSPFSFLHAWRMKDEWRTKKHEVDPSKRKKNNLKSIWWIWCGKNTQLQRDREKKTEMIEIEISFRQLKLAFFLCVWT